MNEPGNVRDEVAPAGGFVAGSWGHTIEPVPCRHGFIAPECPDCDVPDYWPRALDEPEPVDVDE